MRALTRRPAVLAGVASVPAAPGASRAEDGAIDNYCPAPEFADISNKLNSPPLTTAGLCGKVVRIARDVFRGVPGGHARQPGAAARGRGDVSLAQSAALEPLCPGRHLDARRGEGDACARRRRGEPHVPVRLFTVASSERPVTVVVVNGRSQPPVTVQESRLHTLFDGGDYGKHVMTLSIPKAGSGREQPPTQGRETF